MHFVVLVVFLVQRVVLLIVSQRRQKIVLEHPVVAHKLGIPAPNGSRGTRDAVINRNGRQWHLVGGDPEVYQIGRITVFVIDNVIVQLAREVHLQGVGMRHVARPRVTAGVNELVHTRRVAAHSHHGQLPGVGIERVGGALDDEVVALHDIRQRRVLDAPTQHVVAGEGTRRIEVLVGHEVVDTVIRRHLDRRTAERLGHSFFLIAPYQEVGIHVVVDGVVGHDIDRPGAVVTAQFDRCGVVRRGVADRLVEHRIRNGGVAVARQAVLVELVQIGRVQLRGHRVVLDAERSVEGPVVRNLVRLGNAVIVVRNVLVNIGSGDDAKLGGYRRIEFDGEFGGVHRLGRIPVELEERHAVVVAVGMLHDGQPARPLTVSLQGAVHTVGHGRDDDITHVRGELDIYCTAVVVLVVVAAGMRHPAEDFHFALTGELVRDMTIGQCQVVVDGSIRPNGYLEVNLLGTRCVDGIVVLFFQIVVRLRPVRYKHQYHHGKDNCKKSFHMYYCVCYFTEGDVLK